MSIERENLKDILSQFVDTLVDNEVSEIRTELEHTQKTIREEISTLKNDIILEMAQVREEIHSELLSMRKSRTDLETKSKEFTQKEAAIYKHLKTIAVKMAETFSEQESDYSEMFKKLEERVHRNENSLFITRNDHDKLTMVLNTFAVGLSAMAPSPDETAPEEPSLIIPSLMPSESHVENNQEPTEQILPLPETVAFQSNPIETDIPVVDTKSHRFVNHPSSFSN